MRHILLAFGVRYGIVLAGGSRMPVWSIINFLERRIDKTHCSLLQILVGVVYSLSGQKSSYSEIQITLIC